MRNKIFDNEITWFDTKTASAYICISPQALRNKCSRGEIPYYRLGKRDLRFKRSDLDRLLESSKKFGG